jgi:hypothetical protein
MKKIFSVCVFVIVLTCGCARHRHSTADTHLPSILPQHQENFANRAKRSPNEKIQAEGATALQNIY